MDSPKDRANDPNRKSAHTHTDEELLAKFNEISAHIKAQPVIKNWQWDTPDGASYDTDGKRLDVPSRSWSMPDGK
jgi:hypothetical protein